MTAEHLTDEQIENVFVKAQFAECEGDSFSAGLRAVFEAGKAAASSGDTIAVPRELLVALRDEGPCDFDHHGGCQGHGYLALDPGEVCPQEELRQLLSGSGDTEDKGQEEGR